MNIQDLMRIPKPAWIAMGFLFLNRLGFFISIPYLVFFLSYQQYSTISIGAIVSAQWLAYGIAGFSLGFLGDKYGKRRIMLISLVLTGTMSFAMAFCNSVFSYLIVNLLIGGTRSIFSAALPAYVTDITPQSVHRLVFNVTFLVVNLAGAFGPLIGVYFAHQHSGTIFIISGVIFYASALLMPFVLAKDPSEPSQSQQVALKLSTVFNLLAKDRVLLGILIATTIYWFAYAHMEAPIAQVLEMRDPNSATFLFGLMWIINTLMIVFLQLPSALVSKHVPVLWLCYAGTLLICLCFLGLAFFYSGTAFVLCIILLTMGEIIVSPLSNVIVAQIAPENLRSTYFGVIALASIGGGLSPIVGSIFLQFFGSEVLFLFITGLIVLNFFLYYYALSDRVTS